MSFGKVAVIGSGGRMGTMFMQRLESCGIVACGIDQPLDETVLKQCADADLALLCVPASCLADVVRALALFLPPDAVLADIASVKVRPMQAMLAGWSGAVVGTHPLFGPSPSREETSVAVVPGRSKQAAGSVIELLTALGFSPFLTTAHVHDKAMAVIQGLNFLSEAAYFGMVGASAKLKPFLTPSFKRRFLAARTLLLNNGELFTGLMDENPYLLGVLRQYRRALSSVTAEEAEKLLTNARTWKELIESEDR